LSEANVELIKYDAACRALAEAKSVDEVKDFRDKAKAIEAYAKQARNKDMQADAMEITLRAERRLGELLADAPKATGGQYGGKQPLDGTRNAPSNAPQTLADMGIDKKLSSRSQKIAKIEPAQFEAIIDSARGKITSPSIKAVHVSHNSGENEWYTPPEIIEKARRVLGCIETDPASSVIANEAIKAKWFYTADDNGLEQVWRGGVWMNPPYSQPLVSEFCRAFLEKYNASEFTGGLVLVNNATETNWLQPLLIECSAVCFIKGRLKFIDASGEPSGAPLQGQCILYFGNNIHVFIKEFSTIGIVMRGIQ